MENNNKQGGSDVSELWKEVDFTVNPSLEGIAGTADAIDKVFCLFEIRYGVQFHRAFSDVESVNLAKRLWVDSLKQFDSKEIISGARIIVAESPYVPTLCKMLTTVRRSVTQNNDHEKLMYNARKTTISLL